MFDVEYKGRKICFSSIYIHFITNLLYFLCMPMLKTNGMAMVRNTHQMNSKKRRYFEEIENYLKYGDADHVSFYVC